MFKTLKTLLQTTGASLLLVLAISPLTVLAGANSISLRIENLGGGSVGDQIDVVMTVNAEDALSVAQTKVMYDTARVKYISTGYANSPLTNDTPDERYEPGAVTISRFVLGGPYPTGEFTLGSIRFELLDTSENITFTIDADATYAFEGTAGTDVISTVSGAVYSASSQQSQGSSPEEIDQTGRQDENPERENSAAADPVSSEPTSRQQAGAGNGNPAAATPTADNDKGDMSSGSSALLMLIGAGVLATIAGVVLFMLTKRGKKDKTPIQSPTITSQPSSSSGDPSTIITPDDQNK